MSFFVIPWSFFLGTVKIFFVPAYCSPWETIKKNVSNVSPKSVNMKIIQAGRKADFLTGADVFILKFGKALSGC